MSLYHWISGFEPTNGELVTISCVTLNEGFDAERAVTEAYSMDDIRENGFYMVAAPDPNEGEANIGMVYVNLTEPPEIREVTREDIFIGLAHD